MTMNNIQQARKRLDILTTNIIYRPHTSNQYTEQSIKAGFGTLGYNVNIQNAMWVEYKKFISTYIHKN